MMSVFPKNLDLDFVNNQFLPKLDRKLGLRVVSVGDDVLKAELPVTEEILQPFGIMHGGISCVVGESLGSVCGMMCLKDEKLTIVGQNLYALHLRPAYAGMTLEAIVTPQHVGRRSHIWEILLRDKATQKHTAKITLTLAVVEKAAKTKPAGAP